MSTMASQITSLTIVSSNVDSGADQRKHKSSATLAFVQGPCYKETWGLFYKHGLTLFNPSMDK